MSAAQTGAKGAPGAANLTDLGWRHGKDADGHYYRKEGTGQRTASYSSPGQALRAAHRVEDGLPEKEQAPEAVTPRADELLTELAEVISEAAGGDPELEEEGVSLVLDRAREIGLTQEAGTAGSGGGAQFVETAAAQGADLPKAITHEIRLRKRVVEHLTAAGVAARENVSTPSGVVDVVTERAVLNVVCAGRGPQWFDIFDQAHHYRRALVDLNPDAECYVVVCCASESSMKSLRPLADMNDVQVERWGEGGPFPFDAAKFVPTLAEKIVAQVEAAASLEEFRAVADYGALADVEFDTRFTVYEQERVRAALKGLAGRLGVEPAALFQADGAGQHEKVEAALVNERVSIPQTVPRFPDGGSPAVAISRDAPSSDAALLDPELIRTDGGTQARAALDPATVDDYAEKMRAGEVFPEVITFFDGTDYWLADGFHRHAATVKAELAEIAADVRQGTRRDAVLYAVGANARHGLRRTDADKRRAVETLLRDEEWAGWSNREIARRCGVTHTFVGTVREELSGHRSQMEVKARRGDTEYTVNTTNLAGKKSGDEDADLPPEIAAVPLEERSKAFDNFVARAFAPAGAPATSEAPAELSPGGAAPEAEEFTHAPAAEAPAGATEAGPSITVNDRRRLRPEPGDAAAVARAEAAAPAQKAERPPVESLLKGRALVVTYTYLPAMPGRVNVSVRVSGDLTGPPASGEIAFESLASSQVRHTCERVQELIAERVKAAGEKKARTPQAEKIAAAAAANKAAEKTAAKPATRKAAAKKAATKKELLAGVAALKGEFKKGAFVRVAAASDHNSGKRGEVVGLTPGNPRKLRVKFGVKTYDYAPGRLAPWSDKSAKKGGARR